MRAEPCKKHAERGTRGGGQRRGRKQAYLKEPRLDCEQALGVLRWPRNYREEHTPINAWGKHCEQRERALEKQEPTATTTYSNRNPQQAQLNVTQTGTAPQQLNEENTQQLARIEGEHRQHTDVTPTHTEHAPWKIRAQNIGAVLRGVVATTDRGGHPQTSAGTHTLPRGHLAGDESAAQRYALEPRRLASARPPHRLLLLCL
jgi:hypothetical protein